MRDALSIGGVIVILLGLSGVGFSAYEFTQPIGGGGFTFYIYFLIGSLVVAVTGAALRTFANRGR